MAGFVTGWKPADDEDVSIGSDGEQGEKCPGKAVPDQSACGAADEDHTDNVCSLCHDGGELLACDGPCGRSFHPTLQSGPEDGECPSLGMTEEELQSLVASEGSVFLCRNCEKGIHQCFKCKALGEFLSGRHGALPGGQVFLCKERGCGKFYHAGCLRFTAGQEFTCPLHKCHSKDCKKKSSGTTGDEELTVCRLCPRAWHEECVPRYISFEDDGDTPQRGWKLRDDESGETTAAFIFCSEHDYELNRRGKPSYKSQSMVLFPGETARGKGINPGFVNAAREWECPGCFKTGCLNIVLQESRIFATCRLCETGYWVNPNKYDRDGRFSKFGGKFTIVSRPKRKRWL